MFADDLHVRLLWRAYQVLHTPNEVLVDKLGLDIPPAPELILEEILPRQIHISWKQPELPNSIHKHVVHINGKKGLLYAPHLCSRLVLISVYSGRDQADRDCNCNS